MMPRRRMISGLLLISCGRRTTRGRKSSGCQDAFERGRGDGEGATAGEGDTLAFNEGRRRNPQDLRVHFERRDSGILPRAPRTELANTPLIGLR